MLEVSQWSTRARSGLGVFWLSTSACLDTTGIAATDGSVTLPSVNVF